MLSATEQCYFSTRERERGRERAREGDREREGEREREREEGTRFNIYFLVTRKHRL